MRFRAIGAALPRTLRSAARGPGRGAALAARRVFLYPFSFRWFKEGSSCAVYRLFLPPPPLLPLIPFLSPFAPVQPCRAPPAAVGGPVRRCPRTARPARGRRRRRLCSARRAGAGAKPGSARPRPAARGPPGGSGRCGGGGRVQRRRPEPPVSGGAVGGGGGFLGPEEPAGRAPRAARRLTLPLPCPAWLPSARLSG